MAAARVLLEAGGPDAVTMQAVADQVGIRAPSLYKRFADRSALLSALADVIAADLAVAVAPPARIQRPSDTAKRMASKYRAFARRSPRSYQLLFGAGGAQPSPTANAQAAGGVLRVAEALVGPGDALEAARLLVAYLHGFVSMELGGAFRLGGNVTDAFEYGLDTLLRGLTHRAA